MIAPLKPDYTVLSLWRGELTGMKTMPVILEEVARRQKVAIREIMSYAKTVRIVDARHEAMYLMHLAGRSTVQIGKFMGRDHSSVVSALRKYKHLNGGESDERPVRVNGEPS